MGGTDGVLGLWDRAVLRRTHADLTGRALVPDGAGVADHSTHVAGTLIGDGTGQPLATGMAPAGRLLSYDWTLDLLEMRHAGPALSVSVHPYGFAMGWADNPACADRASWLGRAEESEDRRFGRYGREAAALDGVLVETGLLSVWAAGNEREDVGASGGQAHYHFPDCETVFDDEHASELELQWDTMGMQLAAKNSLVVGAVGHVTEHPPEPSAVVPMGFSSFGPMDDGRIKPELVAAGELVYSTVASADDAYQSFSGTSSSAAVVAGGVALLTELYRDLNDGRDPRADEVKALLLHTAAASGEDLRPDYRMGFGLFDALAAAELLEADAEAAAGGDGLRHVRVGRVEQGAPLELETAEVPSGEALRVTLVWLDPPGAPAAGGLDDLTPALVNDLDLTLVAPDGTGRFPWSLDPREPERGATADGKNAVDTVERVDVASADNVQDGAWTVRVAVDGATHRLRPQSFALVSSVPLSAPQQPVLGTRRSVLVEVASGEMAEAVPIAVRNLGEGALEWRATTPTPWITLSASSGEAPEGFELNVDPDGLPVGEHLGRVEVDAGEAGSQTIGVLLRVLCAPACDGIECGVDPVCGQPCGACAMGEACDAGGSCVPHAAGCPGVDLGSHLGMLVALGSTESAGDDFQGSCGGNGGQDRAFSWTAPRAGRYRFTTDGSKHDTVLYVRDGCDGPELACSDDAEGLTSSLTVALDADQQVQVVVDGRGAAGEFYLYAGEAPCPDATLGSMLGAPLHRANLVDSDDTYAGSCTGDGRRDVMLSWTAPTDDTFTFTAQGAAGVYLRAGASCDGAELDCAESSGDGAPTVSAALSAGEAVMLGVELSPPFDVALSITAAGGQCVGTCDGSPNGGGCFCDPACVALGDCCEDACESCGSCCVPACDGKSCGPDGCGGRCGECGAGELCDSGDCVADACAELPAGATCDDGNACTDGDRCIGGRCAGSPLSCPGGARCEPQAGGCPGAPTCGDGGVCAQDGGVEENDMLEPPQDDSAEDGGGCGCRVGARPRPASRLAGASLLLFAAALRRRRRRRSAAPHVGGRAGL